MNSALKSRLSPVCMAFVRSHLQRDYRFLSSSDKNCKKDLLGAYKIASSGDFGMYRLCEELLHQKTTTACENLNLQISDMSKLLACSQFDTCQRKRFVPSCNQVVNDAFGKCWTKSEERTSRENGDLWYR